MRRLVTFPSDPIETYLRQGKNFNYLENYFNPMGYFDEVYCISLDSQRKTTTFGSITYIKCGVREIGKIVEKIKPDVIRAYGGYYATDLSQVAKRNDIPVLVSVHDTNPELIFDSIRNADYVVCMSECVREVVAKKICCRIDDLLVLPNRVDTIVFKHQKNVEFFENLNSKYGKGRHLLHIGRKSTQKNIDTVIKALALLPDDVSVIFVGMGDDIEYRRLAKEKGVENRCFWVESIQKNELPLWYSWCDCFCTPSRWEGFGFVFIEAAACESFIVTSNIAPMNEYLTNGVDAVLVDDFENPECIATAVLEGLSDIEMNKSIKSNARKVGMKFDKRVVDLLEIDIYNMVIKNGSRKGALPKKEKNKILSRYEKNKKYIERISCEFNKLRKKIRWFIYGI